MVDFVDKTDESSGGKGTPLNRLNMMAIQGFDTIDTVFMPDGSIVETNKLGHKLTTVFYDGYITETFEGEKKIVKTTTFNPNGSISEVTK